MHNLNRWEGGLSGFKVEEWKVDFRESWDFFVDLSSSRKSWTVDGHKQEGTLPPQLLVIFLFNNELTTL